MFDIADDLAPTRVRPGGAETLVASDNPALVDPGSGTITTYRQLTVAVGALLDHLGGERQVLLVEATPTLSTIVLYLTAWTGRHVVILCPPGRNEDFAALAARFAPDFVAPAGDRDDAVARLTACHGASSEPVHPDLALLLPTSGSTGAAKAVRLSHANLVANARSIAQYLDIGGDERALLNLPIHYSYGLSVLNSHLLAGASVILDPRSMTDEGLWADAGRFGATSFAGVPYSYELLDQVNLAKRAPASLRYFTQAGGRLPPERVARYAALARERGWRFFVMYGQTEATARMAYLPPERIEDEPDAVGRAIPGGAFSLRAEDGTDITAVETPGELVYTGPNVMMGYATARADLALPPQPPVLATGDMAVRTRSGLYRITGRRSRFVKIFGNRVDLDEVERILERQGIAAIATGNDERLALVTQEETGDERIVALLGTALKLPAERIAVLALPDPPRLPSGKIDQVALRTLVEERLAARAAAHDGEDDTVASLYVRMFGDAARDDAASFLSLGGDSLTYITTALALEDIIGPLPDGWEAMTVGELSALAAAPNPGPAVTSGVPAIRDNLDTLRGLACLLVVAFHVVGVDASAGLRLPMTSGWHVAVDSIDFVRMPLFTAMAGYFYALMPGFEEPRLRLVMRKARSLLIPSLFVGGILWFARAAAGETQDPLVPSLTIGFMHLWYLNALFVVFVVMAVIERRRPMATWCGVALGMAALPLSPLAAEHGAFMARNVLYLLPYFLFGVGMRRIPRILYTRATVTVGLAISVVTLALELMWRSSGQPLPWFEPAIGLAAGFAVLPPLFRLVPRLPLFAWIGAYSITIYLWHPMANAAIRAVLQRLDAPSWALFVTGVAVGAGAPILLHRLVERWPRISLPLIGR